MRKFSRLKFHEIKKLNCIITLLAIVGLAGTVNSQPLAGGRAFSLAVCENNTVRAWGSNASGQLGNGTNTASNVPLQVGGLCQVLSVNEISEPFSVSVFPNPGNGHFTLTLSKENGMVEIYNMLGRKVCQAEIINQESGIDLSGYPKGIYIARFFAGQQMQTEKIVIR